MIFFSNFWDSTIFSSYGEFVEFSLRFTAAVSAVAVGQRECGSAYLLINLRSPRDYVGPPFFRSFALSPLDGASVREAHCEQAITAVREAHCAQATVARLVTFESLKWKYSFATNSALLTAHCL